MYKMIIVDDNPWDREGIANIFDWAEIGIEVSGTYSNGKEALDDFERIKPDIILTDILMPMVNGIELAKEIQNINPNTRIIFLSAYNEFDFAKSAIDLDIYGYVLKPITTDELMKAVSKVIGNIESEVSLAREKEEMIRQINDMLPLFQEQFLRDFLFGAYSSLEDVRKRAEFLNINMEVSYLVYVVTLLLNDYEDFSGSMDMIDNFMIVYSIKKIISSYNNNKSRLFIVQTASKEYSFILYLDSSEYDEMMDIVVAIKNDITDKLKLNVSFGISNPSKNLADIPLLYRQSVTAVNTKFISDDALIINYNEIEVLYKNPFDGILDMQVIYKDLNELISMREDEDIEQFINKFIGKDYTFQSENYIKSLLYSIINAIQIILINVNKSLSDIFGDEIIIWNKLQRFESIKDIRQWIFNIIKSVKDHLHSGELTQNGKIVKSIKEIIKNRYSEQLTINDIAESIHFSAIHANNIFKRETGKTIFDYLTEYRIEKAKELLKDPQCRVYQVCEQVGYTNKSHFNLIFKKYTGLTPLEYKNKAIL